MANKPKFKQFNKQQLQEFVDKSTSFQDVLTYMKYNHPNDKRIIQSVKNYCDSLEIKTSHLTLLNETRICKECGKILPNSEFYSSNGKTRLVCKNCVCLKEQSKYRSRKKQLDEYKLNHPCAKCGCNKPYLLDFHHINPNEKDYTISDNSRAKLETLLQEIDKCIVLCANCHREFHYLNSHSELTLEEYLK